MPNLNSKSKRAGDFPTYRPRIQPRFGDDAQDLNGWLQKWERSSFHAFSLVGEELLELASALFPPVLGVIPGPGEFVGQFLEFL